MQIFTITTSVNLKLLWLMYLSANKDCKKENLQIMKPIKLRNKKNGKFQDEKKHASNCSNLDQCENVANEIKESFLK